MRIWDRNFNCGAWKPPHRNLVSALRAKQPDEHHLATRPLLILYGSGTTPVAKSEVKRPNIQNPQRRSDSEVMPDWRAESDESGHWHQVVPLDRERAANCLCTSP